MMTWLSSNGLTEFQVHRIERYHPSTKRERNASTKSCKSDEVGVCSRTAEEGKGAKSKAKERTRKRSVVVISRVIFEVEDETESLMERE
jgi:hypothetical protein